MSVNKIFIPTLISSITYEPVRTLPHIYFYNGLKESEPYFIQHYPSGSSTSSVVVSEQNSFPYVDYYDGLTPSTGSNSLLFFNEQAVYGETPTASLYTEYWDTYVSLLYNPRTRLFKASAIIPLADYFDMELNDIVQWRGNYYHLRAINDYNLKDGTCKIELLGPIIRDAADRLPEPTPPISDCTFNFSSAFDGIASINVDYLIVAGGGGGGSRHAGGGGAGGYLTGSLIVSGSTPMPIVIGAGGAGSIGTGIGSKGSNSTFNGLTSHGGGFGAGGGVIDNGGVGGSGGGAVGVSGSIGGASSGSQGFAGGGGVSFAGGGGGGASQIGFSGTRVLTENRPGTGGSGSAWLDGTFRAGGGGGAGQGDFNVQSTLIASGGIGGGGQGGNGEFFTTLTGSNGVVNTGGGGGGAAGRGDSAGDGGSGGSGVVILRYIGSPVATGGNITQSGSYTYHTFTSSGDFTTQL
jgi:hypothetical protein